MLNLNSYVPPAQTPVLDPSIPYKRIRIVDQNDVKELYPFISKYIREPSLADSITEFAINCKSWPGPNSPGLFREARKHRLLGLDELVDAEIENHVRGLGLSEKTTEAMVRSLQVWREDGGQVVATGDLNKQRHDFAQTATVILLSLSRNVTKLYLGHVHPRSWLGEYLLKSNYGLLSRPGLQKLESVESIPGGDLMDDERYYGVMEILDHIRFFHRLPNMRTFTMEGVQEYQSNRSLFVPGTSEIKKIYLGHCDMASSFLGTIIRIPKALEEFHLSLGGLNSIDGGSPMVLSKALGKALFEHKESLKVLDMDFTSTNVEYRRLRLYEEEDPRTRSIWRPSEREHDEYFRLDEAITDRKVWLFDVPDTQEYGYTIGSFHDFTSLTHLSIPIKELLGSIDDWEGEPPFRLFEQPPSRLIDSLPPSLEYLCLYGYVRGHSPDVDEHVDELMKGKAERLPLLKEVKGVDETIPGVSALDARECGDDTVAWEKPEPDVSWLKE